MSIAKFLSKVGSELESKGFQVKYIPQADRGIIKSTFDKISHDQILSEYVDYEPRRSLSHLCEKYDIDNIRGFVFPQMVYDRSYCTPSHRQYWFSGTKTLDYDYYRSLLHQALDYLNKLYESGNGGVPLQWQGGEVLRRTLQRVADYHGYPSVRASASPVPGSVFLRSTERMNLPLIESASYEQMTTDQRQTAREFRNRVLNSTKYVISGSDSEPGSAYKDIQQKIRRILAYRSDIGSVIINWFRRCVAKPLFANVAEQLYMTESESRRFINTNQYVFYPIQYFRESRVTMRAAEFYNQVWFIEYLSRSLPRGYQLVVKDHPEQIGSLPLSHVRAIRKYSSAVAPNISGREIIEEASAVVVLNNTVGYEALLYEKPVVSVADAVYSDLKYTYHVNNLGELSDQLSMAISSGGLTESEIIEFTHGLLLSTYDGIWGNTSEENIVDFTNSVDCFLSNRDTEVTN